MILPPEERNYLMTKDLGAALHAAGLLPQWPWISRITIDAKAGGAVMMYLEVIGSGKLLKVIPGLEGVEIKYVDGPEPTETDHGDSDP